MKEKTGDKNQTRVTSPPRLNSEIYKYDSENGDYNIDKDKLFGLVYDINWYPSFIMIDKGSYREIGETPVENLLSVIYQR